MNDDYRDVSDIVTAVIALPPEKIHGNLADIHQRVEKIAQFERVTFEEDKDQGNPTFYPLKKVKMLHKNAMDEYNKSEELDFHKKSFLIGEINKMNLHLKSLEQRNEKNEE